MTSTKDTGTCDAFLQRAKERLIKPGALQPPFEGAWCVALDVQLKKLLPGHIDSDLSLLTRVVNCFAAVPVEDIETLYVALRDSVKLDPPKSEDERHWLNELTCFAFIRTLEPDFLIKHLRVDDAAKAPRAGSAMLPTSSALMASMAYTQLVLGLRFDGSQHGRSDRWIDIEQFSDRTDAVQAILTEVVQRIPVAPGTPRRNPDIAPTDEELQALIRQQLSPLRARFSEAHIKGVASGLCVRRPKALPDDQWAAILASVATKLKTNVVGFERENQANMTRTESLLTPEDLDYQLGLIFAQIKAAPSASRPPVAAAARYEVDSFEFDFFLSHASEDKSGFVDGLSESLQEQGWRVWYDKHQLMVGDSLIKSIEHGLSRSRYAVLVVSPDSLTKSGWVEAEWEAVLARQTSLGEQRVLPVWLHVSPKEVSDSHPFLARLLAADGTKGVAEVVLQLQKRARRGEIHQ